MDDATWRQVEQIVSDGDPDRYVSAFFARAGVRRQLLALYAFHHEVARIGAIAREPMAGHIRLAWWREQIGAMFDGASVHAPVAVALADAVRAHALPRELFDRYLDARALDLEETPFVDEAALEAHADAVEGGMVRLAARILGAEARADRAATHAGVAIACAGHLRDLTLFAPLRRCRLPVRLLDEAGVNAEDIFAQEASAGLRRAFDRMAATTQCALFELRMSRSPVAAKAALAVATLARWPASARFDPLKPEPMPAWRRVASLSLANLTGRY